MNDTIMNKIFSDMESNGIKYCHFKSNQHLDESFSGKSDFDVLFDVNRKEDVTKILIQNNAKQFESPCINNYKGVENWLAFDENTGVIYHIHLHYHLITGTSHVKEYDIYWYDRILQDAIKSEEYGIYINNPELEYILLLTRIALKCGILTYIRSTAGKYKLSNAMNKELIYLVDKVDEGKLRSYINEICPDLLDVMIGCFKAKSIKARDFSCLYKGVRKMLKEHRSCSYVSAVIKSRKEEKYGEKGKKEKAKGNFFITKKVHEGHGLAIAFIGVDGSGKSTTKEEIEKWLSKKIDCTDLYLGTGNGSKDRIVNLLKIKNYYWRKITGKKYSDVGYMDEIKIVLRTTKVNKKNLIKMNEYRKNGGITVMDRFPQLEKPDMNDGIKIPGLVKKLKGNKISESRFENMYKQEEDNISIVKEIHPDIIFRLNISLDTCLNRKPEHKGKEEYFEKKLADLNSLKYVGSKIIEINAEQDRESEMLEIKRIIWSYL